MDETSMKMDLLRKFAEAGGGETSEEASGKCECDCEACKACEYKKEEL